MIINYEQEGLQCTSIWMALFTWPTEIERSSSQKSRSYLKSQQSLIKNKKSLHQGGNTFLPQLIPGEGLTCNLHGGKSQHWHDHRMAVWHIQWVEL